MVVNFLVVDIIGVIGVIVAVTGMHHADLHTSCPFDAPAA